MKKQHFEKAIYLYIMINVMIIFVGSVLLKLTIISGLSMQYVFLALGIIGIIIFLLEKIICRRKFNILDIILICLTICAIISTALSTNIKVSLVGFFGRNEGLYVIIYYYILIYLSTLIDNKNYKKRIIFIILMFGICQIFIAVLQKTNLLDNIYLLARKGRAANGFQSSPDFLGTFALLCTSLSLGMYVLQKNKKTFYYICSLLFFAGLLFSNTMSAMVGLTFVIISLIIISIWLIIKKETSEKILLKSTCILISFLIIFIISNKMNLTTMSKQISQTSNEVNSLVSENKIDDSFGTDRIYVWRNAISVSPNYFVHGVGLDCFIYAFGDKPLCKKNSRVCFDKAHNEYLQILITEGLPSILIYIGLLASVVFLSIKSLLKNFDFIKATLFITFIGYIVQANFNIRIINVAPLFFIVFGLLISREDFLDLKIYNFIKRFLDIIISIFVLIITMPIFLIIAFLIKKDDKGTIFYKHKRVGLKGKEIRVIKFRTMITNADQLYSSFDKKQKKEYDDNFKLKKDFRVTKIGQKLRDYNLDELPQFINVLIGDMSIIGPRPVVREELKKYKEEETAFLSVKPGISGVWTCFRLNGMSYDERVALELLYIKKRSFLFDFKCFLKTILIILRLGNKL